MIVVACKCYRSTARTPKSNRCHGRIILHDNGEIDIIPTNHKLIKEEKWEGRTFTTHWSKKDKNRLVCPESDQIQALALKLVSHQFASAHDWC